MYLAVLNKWLQLYGKTNFSSSEDVAASTEEQLASMEEINSSAPMLASMAEELSTLVSRFKF